MWLTGWARWHQHLRWSSPWRINKSFPSSPNQTRNEPEIQISKWNSPLSGLFHPVNHTNRKPELHTWLPNGPQDERNSLRSNDLFCFVSHLNINHKSRSISHKRRNKWKYFACLLQPPSGWVFATADSNLDVSADNSIPNFRNLLPSFVAVFVCLLRFDIFESSPGCWT